MATKTKEKQRTQTYSTAQTTVIWYGGSNEGYNITTSAGYDIPTVIIDAQEDPFENIDLYGSNLKLTEDARKLRSNATYQSAVLDNLTKAAAGSQGELELLLENTITTSSAQTTTVNYDANSKYKSYSDYWKEKPERDKKMLTDKKGHEPPHEPRVLAYGSADPNLIKIAFFLGQVQDEPASESGSTQTSNQPRPVQRKNPAYTTGLIAFGDKGVQNTKEGPGLKPKGENKYSRE